MSFYPHSFFAPVERFGIGRDRKVWYNVLFLPEDLIAELPLKQYPRLRIEGEIADMPISNAIIPAGDNRYYVMISPKIMKDADLHIGDDVEIRFGLADQDHVDVPKALEDALKANDQFYALWDTLTPGKRRMFSFHVKGAKTEKTRARRVDEAMDALEHHRGDLKACLKKRREQRNQGA